MSKKRWWSVAVSGALLLVCGCQADIHYQAAAVERARKFLLQEAVRELDLEQQSFVRYTDPILLHAPCIGETGRGVDGNLKSELRQICAVWEIPGKDKLFMVFGVSTPRMADWYPNRLLKKNFRKPVKGLEILSKEALAFARLNLMDKLSVAEMNHLRFTMPSLAAGKFPAAAKQAVGKKTTQYVLSWQLDGRAVVFIGSAPDGDLSSWKCESAGFYTPEEMARYTGKLLVSSENAFGYELPGAGK